MERYQQIKKDNKDNTDCAAIMIRKRKADKKINNELGTMLECGKCGKCGKWTNTTDQMDYRDIHVSTITSYGYVNSMASKKTTSKGNCKSKCKQRTVYINATLPSCEPPAEICD